MIVNNKIRRCLRLVILCFAFVVAFFGCSTKAYASKDVTSKLKNDKGIKWITKNMIYYGAIEHERGNISNNKIVKFKMNATNKYSIAAVLTANKYRKYDSKKYKEPKYKDNKLYMPLINVSYANKLYKKLYGSNVNYEKVKNKKGYFLKKKKKCYAIFGEFGTVIPKYSIEEIIKKKKGIYRITAKIKLKMDDGSQIYTVGTMWITVKKDKKATYGYKVKNISYTMLN